MKSLNIYNVKILVLLMSRIPVTSLRFLHPLTDLKNRNKKGMDYKLTPSIYRC